MRRSTPGKPSAWDTLTSTMRAPSIWCCSAATSLRPGHQQVITPSSTSQPMAASTPSGTLSTPTMAYLARFAGVMVTGRGTTFGPSVTIADRTFASWTISPKRAWTITAAGRRKVEVDSRLRPGIATMITGTCNTCKGVSTYPSNGVPRYCVCSKDKGITVCRWKSLEESSQVRDRSF